MKRTGFLSFGHWRADSGSQTRTAADALRQANRIEIGTAVIDMR
jgi:hypothetical protein